MRAGSLKEGDRFYFEDDLPGLGGSTYTVVTLNVTFHDVIHALVDQSVVVEYIMKERQVVRVEE